MAQQFPELATTTPHGKIELQLSRFRYTGRSTNRILGINGGTADLSHFLRLYRAEVEQMSAPGMQWPVIVLVDNDSGSLPVYNTIKQLTGRKPSGNEDHIHVTRNLYVVATPIPAHSKQSKIEDFFPQQILAATLAGKTFNPSNDYNPDSEYGKADFAYKIVEPNAGTIDFGGFKVLLERLAGVIKAHRMKLVPPPLPGAP